MLSYSQTLISIHDYWKTTALTRQTFVGKVMSLLFNMLSRFVMVFLPRSKRPLILCLQWPSAVILDSKKIRSVTVSIVISPILQMRTLRQRERKQPAVLVSGKTRRWIPTTWLALLHCLCPKHLSLPWSMEATLELQLSCFLLWTCPKVPQPY